MKLISYTIKAVLYSHKKKKGRYAISHFGYIQIDGEWVEAVAYYKAGNPDDVYFRSCTEFDDTFKEYTQTTP